jgi:hypothetical protein
MEELVELASIIVIEEAVNKDAMVWSNGNTRGRKRIRKELIRLQSKVREEGISHVRPSYSFLAPPP